jgi:hypothetical protein
MSANMTSVNVGRVNATNLPVMLEMVDFHCLQVLRHLCVVEGLRSYHTSSARGSRLKDY